MRVLITGGTGFLGSNIALRLKKQNHDVTVLGRNVNAGDKLTRAGIKFFKADLCEAEKIIAACQAQQFVIHCAALASPWGKYDEFYRANVVGTRNVIAACVRNKVQRLINISTPSIYFDYQHRLNIKESDPLPKKQVTYYGATKLLADDEVQKAKASGLETIGLRPRALFGIGDETVLGRILRNAMRQSLPVIDGGESFVDLTYIDNAVDAVELCLTAPANLMGNTYNITNGEPLPMKIVIEKLISRLPHKVQLKNLSFFSAMTIATALESIYKLLRIRKEPPLTRYAVGLMSKSQTLDITKARAELGYRPKVSLDAGFEIYCQWWQKEVLKKI